MMSTPDVFEEIRRDYLKQVSDIDVTKLKDRLGLTLDGNAAIIPFLGTSYRISTNGIVDNQDRHPSHSVSVVLCKYLLMCPQTPPTQTDWVTYKDFKDAAPFVEGFLNNAEKPISRTFSGRLLNLEKACKELGGRRSEEDFPYDLSVRFDALPKVPVLMLFNDQDEEFPAHCSLLFERRAEKYLDMECLAMTGWALAEWLKERAQL
jgi:hypothetical protein